MGIITVLWQFGHCATFPAKDSSADISILQRGHVNVTSNVSDIEFSLYFVVTISKSPTNPETTQRIIIYSHFGEPKCIVNS
jgi:hypothetical protein